MFADRQDAGRRLALGLTAWKDERPVVLALGLGGVPVAAEVARGLRAPLDIVLVAEVGLPQQPDLVAGVVVDCFEQEDTTNTAVARELTGSIAHLQAELANRAHMLRQRRESLVGHRPPPRLLGRTAILAGDGGASLRATRAAVRFLRRRRVARVVVALPVAGRSKRERLREEVDAVVCLHPVAEPWAMDIYFDDFTPVSEEQARRLLDPRPAAPTLEAAARVRAAAGRGGPHGTH